MKKILIVTILAFLTGCINSKDSSIVIPEQYDLDSFPDRETLFDESTLNDIASDMKIEEIDVPFLCPPPQTSQLNECLMSTYREYYPANRYNGIQVPLFNELLIEFAQGNISKSEAIERIQSLGTWIEESDRVDSGEIEYFLTEIIVDSFQTETHLANKIWAEKIEHGLTPEGAYSEVAIYYDESTNMNTVAVIGVGMAFIDPNAWE